MFYLNIISAAFLTIAIEYVPYLINTFLMPIKENGEKSTFWFATDNSMCIAFMSTYVAFLVDTRWCSDTKESLSG